MRSFLRHPWAGAVSWVLALAIAAASLAALGYQARDPDSRLYAEMAARMAQGPLSGWIAPSVPPGRYISGLFREHPVGIYLLPALLARLGFPALQAAYVVNAIYQVLSLLLLQWVVASRARPLEARVLCWLAQLLPIAFTFRVRANHEQAVLLGLLLALYGIERAPRHAAWGLAAALGLCALLLVKGVLVLMGLAACALWLLVRPRSEEPGEDPRRAWRALAAAALALLATAFTYDHLYRLATGESFWSAYLERQLGVAAVPQSAAGAAQKAYNVVWYLGRVLWFPFPWSLTLLAALAGPRRSAAEGPGDARAGAGVLFVLLLTAAYVGVFSLSDRRADRYIFPVYYAVGAAGAVAALRAWPRFARSAERLDACGLWVPAAVWLALFALHLAGGLLGIPTVKVWAPDS